jgi:hypothetical protein
MRVSRDTVEELDDYIDENLDDIVALVNDARDRLGDAFGEDVESVSADEVRAEFDEFLDKGDAALNAAALYRVGVGLEVRNDYAGFVVDEIVGRNLAAIVAGNDPDRTLAEATFHYVDVHTDEVLEETTAGEDDVLAGLAAGVQTRLPGWDWQEEGF